MVLPSSTDVTLDIKDFLSEQEYDRKKAGIVSRIVNTPIEVLYARDTNCAYEVHNKSGERNGFRVVKAKPKLKGIDGNTAIMSVNATEMQITKLMSVSQEYVMAKVMAGAPEKSMFN